MRVLFCIMMNDYVCKYCGFIGKSKHSLSAHIQKCELNPDVINKRNENNKYECRFCHKEFDTLKLCIGHIPHCSDNPKYVENRISLLKGTAKNIGRKHSTKTRKQLSALHIKYALNNPEKFIKTKGNYRTQRYYLDDIVFDSSWEIITYLYFKHHNINIVKSYFSYRYVYENKEHVYFPDFYLPGTDELIEVKGREFARDKIKYDSVDKKLTVYYQDDIISFNAWNKIHIDDYDISKYKIKNKPTVKYERYKYDLKIRNIIKETENKELFFHSLFVFGIDYSKFGCWIKLQEKLSFRFKTPQATARWFKKMMKQYGHLERFIINPYTNKEFTMKFHRRCI